MEKAAIAEKNVWLKVQLVSDVKREGTLVHSVSLRIRQASTM